MNNIGVKLAVRLVDNNNTIGSGFYIPLPKQDYDIIGTAKHCLCNNDPKDCRLENPNVCDNCSDIEFQTLEYKNEDKTNTIEPLDENPIYLSDRDVAFIKVNKNKEIQNVQNIQVEQNGEKLYSYGFPNGTNAEGTDIRFEIPLEVGNNSKLSLPIQTNSSSNLETQQDNLAGLSGSGVYTHSGNLIGVYTETQSIANGIAVKFDNHIISFLRSQSIDFTSSLFESFTSYLDGAFDGFDVVQKPIEFVANSVVKEITPQEILEQLGNDISYSPEFNSIDKLISHLEQNKNKNGRLWKGWLQLLTYLKTLQIKLDDCSNIRIGLDVDHGEHTYKIDLRVKLYFTDKSSYETSLDYIQNSFNKESDSNTCIVFRSETDQKERKIFNTSKGIIDNVAGVNPLVPPKLNIGLIGLSRLSDVVINSDNMNEVRIELKNCLQDAIK